MGATRCRTTRCKLLSRFHISKFYLYILVPDTSAAAVLHAAKVLVKTLFLRLCYGFPYGYLSVFQLIVSLVRYSYFDGSGVMKSAV